MAEEIIKPAGGISLVICGEAGQGIQTVEQFLARVLKDAGYHIFATKEYMSRVRGGSNSTELRIASERVRAPLDRIDILIPLDGDAIDHLRRRISPETVVLVDRKRVPTAENDDFLALDIPFSDLAAEVGGAIFANTVAAGLVAALFGLEEELPTAYVERRFARKGEEIVRKNIEALRLGMKAGTEILASGRFQLDIPRRGGTNREILLAGAEAVALGALAGGCDFIAAYPMTPSTGVLTYLAQHAASFGLVAEQAEDEISAVNMALGAWYAGARAMVSTSGGGFALMEEGVSLAGMLELPLVINLGQRPGPATGLPTRTEQADLEMALYSGHGEFPRIILAPGTIEEAYDLSRVAFDLADRFQVPVFIMTDQALVDSYYNMTDLDVPGVLPERHIVHTEPEYRRYELLPGGISPRGVPGYGDGLVVVDSDEHDEAGHITEDLDLRVCMVEKRLAKLEAVREATMPPTLIGPERYRYLIICWGSTRPTVEEAVRALGRDDTAVLHFKQVYPLHPETALLCGRAEMRVCIEGNATGQFARLLAIHAGVRTEADVHKYNGLWFTVEELAQRLGDILPREGER